jgi:hypothetical protein
MKIFLILVLFAGSIFAEEKEKLVGEIEFFGYAGVDLLKLQEALPFVEGEAFKIEKEGQLAEILQETEISVFEALNRRASDIAPVCCDRSGNWMIYIGLSGKTPICNPQPMDEEKELPEDFIELYERFEIELEDAIRRGAAQEDQSMGYALSVDPPLRETQLAMRDIALEHEEILLDVLKNAAEAKQRTAAAEILGYAKQSKRQFEALVYAARDAEPHVRNNATRALWILADSNPDLAAEVPTDFYIDMLLSKKWSDINKASLVLCSITERDNGKVLDRLHRKDIVERLSEMARWRTWHADYARYLLGRLAGIDEERLELLVKSGQTDEIFDSLLRKNPQ